MESVSMASQVANSPAAYLIIAIIVSITFYKFFMVVYNKITEEKKEKEERITKLQDIQVQDAKIREEKMLEHQEKLLGHLERSNESQERTADAIERINENFDMLNERLNTEIKAVNTRVDDLQQVVQGKGGIQ